MGRLRQCDSFKTGANKLAQLAQKSTVSDAPVTTPSPLGEGYNWRTGARGVGSPSKNWSSHWKAPQLNREYPAQHCVYLPARGGHLLRPTSTPHDRKRSSWPQPKIGRSRFVSALCRCSNHKRKTKVQRTPQLQRRLRAALHLSSSLFVPTFIVLQQCDGLFDLTPSRVLPGRRDAGPPLPETSLVFGNCHA